MSCEVCRSITFVNYHIPVPMINENDIEYSAVGFFDGMKTENIPIDFSKDGFGDLWKYSMKNMKMKQGHYSYQNIFTFGNDNWNNQKDAYFWSEERNKHYPLTFIVFLQLKDYETGSRSIEKRCRDFSQSASLRLGDDGITYSYYTVDKNDFVVCIKCMHYTKAVETIKALHEIEEAVIYSYSVFTVSNKMLAELSEQNYPEIFEQEIASISLKGITNSTDKQIRLDCKYRDLCDRLIEQLYGEHVEDNRLYDILGDDDFRFIARKVKLGRLLRQFAKGGLLCYTERQFRFYLFSSNLVMNTDTPKIDQLGGKIDENIIKLNDQGLKSERCDKLQQVLDRIIETANDCNGGKGGRGEELPYLYAIWQLLQSLKALETAPTKKYDFWSLYHPLSMLIRILSEKRDIPKNQMLHEFIHKISMTLHGTLRTDIQFFQIRDFNVIVHYAPAKLRAFYSLWAIKMNEFYNQLSIVDQRGISGNNMEERHEYSFVFSPGMFKEVSVRQLYEDYEEKRKLMLITSPERYLYLFCWTPLILAHEVAHFVGSCSRSRMERHKIWLQCCTRMLVIELEKFRYNSIERDNSGYNLAEALERAIANSRLYNDLKDQMLKDEVAVREREFKSGHPYHSSNSKKIIIHTFRKTVQNDMRHLISGDSGNILSFMKSNLCFENYSDEERLIIGDHLRKITYNRDKSMQIFVAKFQSDWLAQLIDVFKYLTVEGYADLMMVLSLRISPERYLRSLTDGKTMSSFDKKAEKANTRAVRASLVITTVVYIVQQEPSCFDLQFTSAWSENVACNLVKNIPTNEKACELAAFVYRYLERCKDNNHLKTIRHYTEIYNRSSMSFANREFDFLKDSVIWELLCSYMYTCAQAYVQAINTDMMLRKQQEQLRNTYEAVSGDTIYAAVQEMENFLEDFEQRAVL